MVQARKSTDNLVIEKKSGGAAEGGEDTEEEPERKKAKQKKGHGSFEDGIFQPKLMKPLKNQLEQCQEVRTRVTNS